LPVRPLLTRQGFIAARINASEGQCCPTRLGSGPRTLLNNLALVNATNQVDIAAQRI
jgi:hypothetical protein